MTPELLAAIEKMETDLNWRGPGGRTMAYILLPRELAEAVLAKLKAGPK